MVGTLLILAAIFSLSDNLVHIEAKKQGVELSSGNFLSNIFGKAAPDYVDTNKYHVLKKGHDIKLSGKPNGVVRDGNASRYSVNPQDYRGISPIPKMEVEVGDEVLAGQTLFFDKKKPEIKFVSPVSGEVVEIRRGAKRAITNVVVLADKEQRRKEVTPPAVSSSREELISFMKENGVWPLINQRPYDVLADSDVVPENIFISTFDTSPLGVDLNLAVAGREGDFQKGLDVLDKLTKGRVYLGLDGRKGHQPSHAFSQAAGVEKHWFSGKHPAGNVGVQIHHTQPIKGSAVVWTLGVEDVATIGHLFTYGKYNAQKLVSLAGGQFVEPHYARTYKGASIDELCKGNISTEGKTRLISGNVLTGKEVGEDSFVGDKDNLVTGIKEGDDYELFGWLLPVAPRPSVSGTFPNFLVKNHEFEANTNTHGEKRAFVVTGQYESMLPMDIYPQHLMKAIMTGDIERMEGLGINELSEEDIALCEFACTSKQPLQQILRDGIDMMIEQG